MTQLVPVENSFLKQSYTDRSLFEMAHWNAELWSTGHLSCSLMLLILIRLEDFGSPFCFSMVLMPHNRINIKCVRQPHQVSRCQLYSPFHGQQALRELQNFPSLFASKLGTRTGDLPSTAHLQREANLKMSSSCWQTRQFLHYIGGPGHLWPTLTCLLSILWARGVHWFFKKISLLLMLFLYFSLWKKHTLL